MKILARVQNGKMAISDYNRAIMNDFIKQKDNQGTIIAIESRTPESANMRKFFEGAVIPFVTWHQDGMDHRDQEDNKRVRGWLKSEFNGVGVVIKGKTHIVPETTKGELREFAERVLDWCANQGYPIELLQPDEYKEWRDTIYPFGGPETYLEYLESIGKLKRP